MPRRSDRSPGLPYPEDVTAAAPRPSGDPLRALARGSAADVLERLAEGDPLRLAERVARRARERWMLVDVRRALARAQAVAAWRASSYRAGTKLDAWIDACVEEALDQLAGEADGSPGLLRFHRLPSAVREAFCRVVLDGEPLEEFAKRRGASISAVGRDARRAIDALWPDDRSVTR